MIAVERYRQAKKRWPDTLTDLVPAYLPNVPLDPFDAAPVRYCQRDDGVIIYSVGAMVATAMTKVDRKLMKEGTDVGLRLWDVSRRRHLPNLSSR